MQRTRRLLARLWSAERGISSVEYALLLAMIASGIIIGAELLSGAVSDAMNDTAALLDNDTAALLDEETCGNDGGGDGTGGDGGTGEGGDNTC